MNIGFTILLINNFLLYLKKQHKCNASKENKDFPVDGSEYNALACFLLFTKRRELKYKLYQMKDNLFLWFAFANNKKIRIHENTWSKTVQNPFLYLNEYAQQVSQAAGS